MLRHIVLFQLHPNVNEAKRQEALQALRKLCAGSFYVQEWQVDESLDQRKGKLVIQNTLLKAGVTINQWKQAKEHKAVVEFMSQIADWLIADFEENPERK